MVALEVSIKGYSEPSHGSKGLPEVAKTVSGAADDETMLYMELWRACARPLVTVPREKEFAYYISYPVAKMIKKAKETLFPKEKLSKWMTQLILAQDYLHFNRVLHGISRYKP